MHEAAIMDDMLYTLERIKRANGFSLDVAEVTDQVIMHDQASDAVPLVSVFPASTQPAPRYFATYRETYLDLVVLGHVRAGSRSEQRYDLRLLEAEIERAVACDVSRDGWAAETLRCDGVATDEALPPRDGHRDGTASLQMGFRCTSYPEEAPCVHGRTYLQTPAAVAVTPAAWVNAGGVWGAVVADLSDFTASAAGVLAYQGKRTKRHTVNASGSIQADTAGLVSIRLLHEGAELLGTTRVASVQPGEDVPFAFEALADLKEDDTLSIQVSHDGAANVTVSQASLTAVLTARF